MKTSGSIWGKIVVVLRATVLGWVIALVLQAVVGAPGGEPEIDAGSPLGCTNDLSHRMVHLEFPGGRMGTAQER